jgi:hypothetical protein
MTKSIEVTIALMLLFFFVFSAVQINTKKSTLTINESNKDYIFLKTQEDSFREAVDLKDVNNIQDILNNNLDMDFVVRICDYINNSCVYSSDRFTDYKNTKTINYYFVDINKTMNVIFGYS